MIYGIQRMNVDRVNMVDIVVNSTHDRNEFR